MSDSIGAIGFVRVSTDRQDTARQKDEILRYCRYNFVPLVKMIEEPEPRSGRSTAARAGGADALEYYAGLCSGQWGVIERPGYGDLLQTLKAGTPLVDTVIVYALDRISRDAIELLLVQHILAVHKAALVTVSGGGTCDQKSASGWLQFAIQALLAEHECRQIAERTSATLRNKIAAWKAGATGAVHVGRPPIGWMRTAAGDYAHNPESWPRVEQAVTMRNAGSLYKDIAAAVGCSVSRVRSYLEAYSWTPPGAATQEGGQP